MVTAAPSAVNSWTSLITKSVDPARASRHGLKDYLLVNRSPGAKPVRGGNGSQGTTPSLQMLARQRPFREPRSSSWQRGQIKAAGPTIAATRVLIAFSVAIHLRAPVSIARGGQEASLNGYELAPPDGGHQNDGETGRSTWRRLGSPPVLNSKTNRARQVAD